MKAIADALFHVLRRDSLIQSLIGVDSDGEVKVYEGTAKTDVKAPFIVSSFIPGNAPVGVYGDEVAMEVVDVQVTAWGSSRNTVWQLAEACDDALHLGDWPVDPYELKDLRRLSFPQLTPDRDNTNWVQIPLRYRLSFGR